MIPRHSSSGSRPVCQGDTRELLQDRERPELCTAAQHVRGCFAGWLIPSCLHVSRLPGSAAFGGVTSSASSLLSTHPILFSAYGGLGARRLGVDLPFLVHPLDDVARRGLELLLAPFTDVFFQS